MQRICTGECKFACQPCGRDHNHGETYSPRAGSVNHDPPDLSNAHIGTEGSVPSGKAELLDSTPSTCRQELVSLDSRDDKKDRYLRQPTIMVTVPGGDKDTPALRLSDDLSRKIQKALRARRDVSKYQQFFDKEYFRLKQLKDIVDWDSRVNTRLVDRLQGEMEGHEIECIKSTTSRLEDLKSDGELLAQKSRAYAQEMKALDRHLAELQKRHKALREDADDGLDDFYDKFGLLNDYASDLDEKSSLTLDSSALEPEETESHTYSSDGGSSPCSTRHTPQEGLREWANDGAQDEEVFITAPARMITVYDGKKDWPAILPSGELAENIMELILSSRKLDCFSKVLDEEENRLKELKSSAENYLSWREGDIMDLEEIRDKEGGLTQEQERALEENNMKIERAKDVIRLAGKRLDPATTYYNEVAKKYNEALEKVNTILEDVYTKCGLIPALDEEALREEIKSLFPPGDIEHLKEPRRPHWFEFLDEWEWYEGPQYTEEQCNLARKVHKLYTKKWEADYALECHLGSYYKQFQEYVKAQVNRPHVDFAEEFGPIFLQRGIDLSMEIKRVEDEMAAARRAALDAGVPEWNLADRPAKIGDTSSIGGKDLAVSNFSERCKQIFTWIEETPELEVGESSFPDFEVVWPLPDKSRFELEKPKPVESGDLKKEGGFSADNGELGEDSEKHDSIFGTLTDIDGDEYREKIDEWSRKVRGGKH